MSRFIWLLLILLAAVVLGLMIAQMPGAVMIQVQHQTLAAPLWLATLGIILLCFVFYFCVRIVRLIYLVPVGWREAYLHSKFKKRQTVLKQALNAYLVGDFKTAKGHFKTLASHRYLAPQTHFMAATSALNEGEFSQAEDFLSKAAKLNLKDKLTLQLLEVDQAIQKTFYADARSRLLELKKQSPNNVAVLKRLLTVELARENYSAVIELLPKLSKQLKATEFETLNVTAFKGAFEAAKSFDQARQIFSNVTKQFVQHPAVLTAYSAACHRFGEDEAASKLLTTRLNKHFNDELFLAFAALQHADAKALSQAEKWFEANPPSANSLSAMSQLYAAHGVAAKAQQYADRAAKMS